MIENTEHTSHPVPRTVPNSEAGLYWRVREFLDPSGGDVWYCLYDYAGPIPKTTSELEVNPNWFSLAEVRAYEESWGF